MKHNAIKVTKAFQSHTAFPENRKAYKSYFIL